MKPSSSFQCHACGSAKGWNVPEYSRFRRVTSDCRPWSAGGRMGVCAACSSAQAILDSAWHQEAARIYEQYAIYHQSQGAEQSVFDQQSGQATSRSVRLVQRLRSEMRLPERGRLLDIGCGNGALLRAFSHAVPGWSLAGVEVSERYKSQVEAVPGVEGLFTCPPTEVPGQFHLISLIHTLEHIPAPREYLDRIRPKLHPDGLLLIEVPDCEQNPFMFLIADHSLHCFLSPLRLLVESAGYTVERIANDWVPKELTVVARPIHSEHAAQGVNSQVVLNQVQSRLAWLQHFVGTAQTLAARGPLGIFGTSIAATWLFAELDGAAAFFVDEDPNRIGRTHLDRPIYPIDGMPKGSQLILALPLALAQAVAKRVPPGLAECHLPLPMPD
jgi:2-polyprenyl-3-methyl-5-hydroxy-6-metoxy-1,4-benzoquinol methylase